MDTYSENPFTPTFGEVPIHLAGREDLLTRFDRAFNARSRRPELTTIITGARGTGKTTILSRAARMARESGWVVAEVTAGSGMLEDVEMRTRKGAAHLVEAPSKARVASIGIPNLMSIELDGRADESGNWRLRMERLLDQIEAAETGLLVTVDEVDGSLEDMVTLASVYQHFVREDRRAGLLMAGLPHNVSVLLNDKTVSFLRRAHLEPLSRISDAEVSAAIEKTVADGGRSISRECADAAAAAVGGFAFMLQLVGYNIWEAAPSRKEILIQDIEWGARAARAQLEARVFKATYSELSATDLRDLEAMLVDAGDSRSGDIAKRMGVSTSQAAQYRRRLIEAGIIGERRRGVVGFDLPYFKEYLLSLR